MRRLARVSDLAGRWFALLILAFAAVAFVLPQGFAWLTAAITPLLAW